MTFSERLKLFGKGLISGVKSAYSGYGNLLDSGARTLISGNASKTSDRIREASNLLGKGSKAKQVALDYASRLAEIGQNQANKAMQLREQAGRTGSFDQGFKSGMKTVGSGVLDTGKAVAYTAGVANPKVLLNPLNLAITGGIGAYRSKVTGEPIEYSIGNTLSQMPYYSGFAKVTDPLIGKVVDKTMKFSPIKSAVASRIASSVGNVVQGVGMDITSKVPTTAGSVALDAVAGLVGGRNLFNTPNAKGFTVGKNTMDEIIEAEDMLKNPLKYVPEQTGTPKARVLYTKEAKEEVVRNARATIDRLAGKYLPNEVFDKTVDRPFAIIKKLVDLNDQNKLTNITVGFTENKKSGLEPISKSLDMDRFKVNEGGVSILDKSKQLSDTFGATPEFYNSLQNKGWSADKIYSVRQIVKDEMATGNIKNPEGFTTYLLRKLHPKDEGIKKTVTDIIGEPKLSPIEMKRADAVAEQLKAEMEAIPVKTKPVVDDYNSGVVGKKAPELPDSSKITTPEQTAEVFKKGKDYFDGRLDSLTQKITALKITPEQFRQAIENPEQTISNNVKSVVNEYQEVLDEALKISGGDTTKRSNYMPHIWEEDRILSEVLPNTFIDNMNLKFSNLLPRLKNAEGFIDDPIQAGKNYVERALSFKYQAQMDATRRGVPVEVVLKEKEIGDKFGEALKSGNTKEIDIIKEFKDLEALKGTEVKLKPVKQAINYYEMATMDGWRNLKKLGIYEEAFAPLQRYKAYANEIYKNQIQPLVGSGDYNSAIKKVVELSSGTENAEKLLNFVQRNKGDSELIDSVLNKATERALKSTAVENLQQKLASYDFETGALKDYVNAMSKVLLGSEVMAKDLLSQTLGFINKSYASGMLGLNIRSGINNLFESKRVLAATDMDSFGKGYKNAFADPDKILNKYGIQSRAVEDLIKQDFGGKKGLKLINGIQDATLIHFSKTEELKDKVFLYAFEEAGKKAGKSGVELTKYVLDNFERYAHKFGGLGTVGIFNNKWVRTMLQFSQFGFKELQTIVDKVPGAIKGIPKQVKSLAKLDTKGAFRSDEVKDLLYLEKLAGENALLHTITGALYGARFEEIWGSLPVQVSEDGITMSFGPLPSLFEEIYLSASQAKEAMADSEETGEPVNWDRIWTNKLKKNLVGLIPAGNQLINKTGGTIQDMLQGYNASASDRVRFLSPETAYDKAIGLMFGPYSTRQSREYFDNKEIPLGENQSNSFRDLNAVDSESAKTFYKGTMQNRDEKNLKESNEKVTIEQILSGKKPVQSAEQGQMIQSRQDSVTGIVRQGITDPYEIGKILDQQAKSNGLASSDISTAEIKSYVTLAKSPSQMSVLDILQKNSAQDEKRSLMSDVLISSDKGFEKLNESQKMQYLASKGITEDDVKSFQTWKLSNTPVKDRADYIIGNKSTNFAQLYKDEVLTLEVAKELERKGYISNADKLMDQMKLTDPYYIKQYQKDLAVKRAKVRAGTVKDMLKAGFQARKNARKLLLNKPKKGKRKISKISVDKSLLTSLEKPKEYAKFKALEL